MTLMSNFGSGKNRNPKPNRTRHRLAVLCMAMLGVICSDASAAESAVSQAAFGSLFTRIVDVPLGAKTSRFDYQSFDPTNSRLYIAGMAQGKLLVFDTKTQKLVASLDGFPKTTGVLAVPALHKVYASVPGAGLGPSLDVGLGMLGLSPGHGAVVLVDADSVKEIKRLPGGVFPDGLAYDARENRVFVSDELGSGITVIDAAADRWVARIAAGGEVGNVQYDTASARLYAPIQSNNQLAVFDPKNNTRLAAYALPGCKHPHGLAIPPNSGIGLVACDENDILVAVTLATGRILSRLPLGHDPDVLAMDPILKRLYVACESGTLSSFDISKPEAPIALGDTAVGSGAHSVAVDPASHLLYLPLANVNGVSVMRVMAPKS